MIQRLRTGAFLAAVLLVSMVACTDTAETPTFDSLSYNQTRFASLTPTPVPTPWLVEDLVACDTTTLARQMRGETTNKLLSDCEVAVSVAQLNTAGALHELPPEESSYIMPLLDKLDRIPPQMRRIFEDAAVDSREIAYLCEVLPQWEANAMAIREWLEGRDPVEWQAVMMDIVRLENVARDVSSAC